MKTFPKKAPATVLIINPLIVWVSTRRFPKDENNKEKVAFTAIALTIIDSNSIRESNRARKNAVKQATSNSSNMGVVYYVFGWAYAIERLVPSSR